MYPKNITMLLKNNFDKTLKMMRNILHRVINIPFIAILIFIFWFPVFTVSAQQAMHMNSDSIHTSFTEDDFFKIVTVSVPDNILLEVTGLAQMPNGNMAVSTRRGEIWIIENPNAGKPYFRLFAAGLHGPMELAYKDGAFYTGQMAELTKVTDTNGDGKADDFETICTWPLTGNYCEYNYGPVIDSLGNFYINMSNGAFGGESKNDFGSKVQGRNGGDMESHVKWRGWVVKISKEGKIMPYAAGLRSPNGIGTNSLGDLFYTENQGGWVATGYISNVKSGDFFGHTESLKWADDPESNVIVRRSDLPSDTADDLLFHEAVKKIKGLKFPSVRMPHGIIGNSTSGFVADTKGDFGPFKDQLFVGDQGQANIARVFLDKVNGEYQGAVFPFKKGFASGVMRLQWGTDGSLFVGMSDRGWSSTGPDRYGLQRLVWTGKIPFEIKSIKAKPDGFEIEFTSPADPKTIADPNSYKISGFDYRYHRKYGSDVYDLKECTVKGIKLSDDGLTARLIVDGLREGYIHEFKLEAVRSGDGNPLLHNFGYYSLNAIPDGNKLDLNDKSIVKAVNTSQFQAPVVSKEKPATKAKVSTNASQTKYLTEMPASWKNDPDITITIGVKPGLKYDLENFVVRSGAKVKVVFNNNDDMQHNLVVVLPNTANEVGEMALALGLDGAAMDYVPKSNKVLYHTSLLQPGSSQTIYFTAPEKEGQYEYVCTYPGHYILMRGIMNVIK